MWTMWFQVPSMKATVAIEAANQATITKSSPNKWCDFFEKIAYLNQSPRPSKLCLRVSQYRVDQHFRRSGTLGDRGRVDRDDGDTHQCWNFVSYVDHLVNKKVTILGLKLQYANGMHSKKKLTDIKECFSKLSLQLIKIFSFAKFGTLASVNYSSS